MTRKCEFQYENGSRCGLFILPPLRQREGWIHLREDFVAKKHPVVPPKSGAGVPASGTASAVRQTGQGSDASPAPDSPHGHPEPINWDCPACVSDFERGWDQLHADWLDA